MIPMMDEVYEALRAEYSHQEIDGFCTRLCERETNIKAIQEIMGHSDVQTTLDIYAEATSEVKHEAMRALQEGKDIL